jgi:CubicO group peptidase (beta-lactamase class C family)
VSRERRADSLARRAFGVRRSAVDGGLEISRPADAGGVLRRFDASAMNGELIADLERFVPEAMRVTGTPGLSIAMALDDEPAWSAAFGWADLAERRRMTTDAVFRVGSVSKLYTATAVLQLVERGAVELHAPIARYLEGVVNPLGERDVTVYDLLTFRSGLATDAVDGAFGAPEPLDSYAREQLNRGVRHEYRGVTAEGARGPRWVAKVGERYAYSSFGVALLGLLVEAVNPDRLGFAEYVKREVFAPLAMMASSFGSAHPQLCTGYARFGDVFVPSPIVTTPLQPAAGMLSTPADHLRWLVAMLRGGEPILSSAGTRAMLTPQVPIAQIMEGREWWNGLVVELANVGSRDRYFGEAGAFPFGWWTDSRAYPEHGLAIVMCVNRWDMTRWFNPPEDSPTGLIAEWLVERLGTPAVARPPRSWAWRASYAMGLTMAERCRGLLGIEQPLTDELVDAMATGTRRCDGGPAEWLPDAFAAGVADMHRSDMTPAGIRDLLASDRVAVGSEDLPLICRRFGRRGRLPVPMPFYADAEPPGSALPFA